MVAVVDPDLHAGSRRVRSFALLVLAPLLLVAAETFAAPITVPTTLLPGAQYRLAFVTAGTRDATSTNIADYDAFVQAEANTEDALSSISWQVIGSTAMVNARDHTGTAVTDYPGVPIYLLNDVKLVNDYSELWNGGLHATLSVNQHGSTLDSIQSPFTGTDFFGDSGHYGTFVLGWSEFPASVIIGSTAYTNELWLRTSYVDPTNSLPFFALSAVLTVPVPEPDPVALLALGVVALLGVRQARVQ